jgi:hypothetical protein
MKDMNIKVVLESFGKPLQGMGVGFGSSLFGVSVAILLNLLIYILNKNFNNYIDNLNDFFNIYIKTDTVEIKLDEQLKAANKELIYTTEIFEVLNKISIQNEKLISIGMNNEINEKLLNVLTDILKQNKTNKLPNKKLPNKKV